MLKVRYNKKSVTAKVNRAIEGTEDEIKDRLSVVASDLAKWSPVDTGAYASSFSVDRSGGRSIRRVSSQGRPRNQDVGSFQTLAYRNMLADIEQIDLEDSRVIFKNGAPHANSVENKYQVFSRARDKNR